MTPRLREQVPHRAYGDTVQSAQIYIPESSKSPHIPGYSRKCPRTRPRPIAAKSEVIRKKDTT